MQPTQLATGLAFSFLLGLSVAEEARAEPVHSGSPLRPDSESDSERARDPRAAASRDCLWPAVGGAVAGLTVGWYAFVGVEALRGRSAFDLEATPGNVALVLGLEVAGMAGGAMVACQLWSDEERVYPTANSVILGGVVGAASLVLPTFWGLKAADVDSDTDNPVASSVALTGAAVLGAFGGGYLGFRLDRAARGAPQVTPLVDGDRAGVRLSWTFW